MINETVFRLNRKKCPCFSMRGAEPIINKPRTEVCHANYVSDDLCLYETCPFVYWFNIIAKSEILYRKFD